MTYNPRLTSYETPAVRDLLKNSVHVGSSVGIPPDRRRGGICIGFAERYVPRGGFNHKHAGTYIDYATAIVRPEDGGPDVSVPLNLGSVGEIAEISIRIGDLPHSEFWEGDVVRFTEAGSDSVIVEHIAYDKQGHLYAVAPEYLRGAVERHSNYYGGSQLRLVERGNIWKLKHGERLTFPDINAEARFYQSLGMSRKVAGTKDGISFGDAVQALRTRHAHQIKVKDKRQVTFVAIAYDDEAFGERMRQHSLRQYGLLEEVAT